MTWLGHFDVYPATRPSSRADPERADDGTCRDHDRVLRRDDDPRQQRPPQRVAAKPEQPVPREVERRRVAAAQILVRRRISQQHRTKDRAEDDEGQDQRGAERELVAPEHAQHLHGSPRRVGLARDGIDVCRRHGSVPDARIENRIKNVDEKVHQEDGDRGNHDRRQNDGEVTLQDGVRSSACRCPESRRSSPLRRRRSGSPRPGRRSL